MIRGLFARLTGEPKRGEALFALAVGEARQAHWFVRGGVADTVEGRFAVLASVIALLIVRMEQSGAAGEAASVALTERFVEAMDTEIREMGVGDPALGKQVRKLVGALGARVERWRSATQSNEALQAAAVRSLYPGGAPSDEAARHGTDALRALWARIAAAKIAQLADGRL